MTLPKRAQEAEQVFNQCRSWEERARLLLQWGNQLPASLPSECTDEHLVAGCESRVWLRAYQEQGLWHFQIYSEARLLRGLLAVLLARCEGLSSAELAHLDLAQWFNQLGLSRQLSPSRSNGLNAVVQKMRSLLG